MNSDRRESGLLAALYTAKQEQQKQPNAFGCTVGKSREQAIYGPRYSLASSHCVARLFILSFYHIFPSEPLAGHSQVRQDFMLFCWMFLLRR